MKLYHDLSIVTLKARTIKLRPFTMKHWKHVQSPVPKHTSQQNEHQPQTCSINNFLLTLTNNVFLQLYKFRSNSYECFEEEF